MVQDYYASIHNTLGVLLIFPGNRYYTQASSSSIATAISTEVPLIVGPEFLEVYTFMPAGGVVVAPAATHAVAIEHLLNMTTKEWTEKSDMVSMGPAAVMLHFAS